LKIHAFTNDVLAKHDATALAGLIKKGEFSIKEVLQASIARAEKVNPKLNAIEAAYFEAAFENTDYNSDGFFAGVPTFIKDLAFVKGYKTTHGSQALTNAPISKINDKITEQLYAQGLIPLGMSTMPEMGFTCTTEFSHKAATLNPWNPAHSCGGSSGGSAALVAAGVVPIAHAADGGGSIRIPSACCGLVGLKPSQGRLLLSKVFENQLIPIATDGIISRSVRDTANFYYQAEKYYQNKKLPPIGMVEKPLDKALKIGFATKAAQGITADAPSQLAVEQTAQLLESLGHKIKEVELPITGQQMDDFKHLWAFNGFAIKHFGKLLFGSYFEPQKLSPFSKGLSKLYWKNAYRTPFFISRLKKAYALYKAFLLEHEIDVFLTPTVSHLAPKIGDMGVAKNFEEVFDKVAKWACFTPHANATGCPSISLPLAHNEDTGLPIGLTFTADMGEEKLLLQLAFQLEQAKPWKRIQD